MAGSDQLRLGYGRAPQRMPVGENDNGNIIDSLENKLNYRRYLRTQSFHDVVWHLNNSRQTDELVFDDVLDPDAVVVADMNGLLTLDNPSFIITPLLHHSGWNDSVHQFNGQVQLQNAATAPGTQWSVPAYGLVTGPGRVEPAATGGIHGKGFWMDGTIGLDFTMPAQAAGQVAAHDWYVGLFVDCRFDDDGVERRLLTFPDQTSIRVYGRRQVVYADAAGNAVNRITLPAVDTVNYPGFLDDLLPKAGWAHLAFQIRHGGSEIEFLLDGLPFHRWQHPTTALFQMTAGHLVAGNVTGAAQPGFRGWIDELRVFAHTVDPESACNHAGGTLIGLHTGYTGAWQTKFADRFPAWAHAEVSAELNNRGESALPFYACFFDYQHDNGAGTATLPAGTTHLRAAMHFPEGPLFHNAPRPGTVANTFCTSCHSAAGAGGLGLAALQYTGVAAVSDPRRQPAQPPAKLYGWIPANLVESDTGSLPATGYAAQPGGDPVDPLLLPTYTGPSAVQGFTLLDGYGHDLVELHNGSTIDPAQLGTGSFQFRANLDSAQGAAVLDLDGTQVTVSSSPYIITPTTLVPGNHTLSAAPTGGVTVSISFTVAGAAIRVIAGYASDFQGNSPKAGWYYCWNRYAAVNVPSGYSPLNWHPGTSQYTAFGLAYPETGTECPYGALSPGGGHPGMGTTQGPTDDRYVIAGYRAKIDGYYGVINGAVSSVASSGSNGGTVLVYLQTASGVTQKFRGVFQPGLGLLMLPRNLGLLHTGDMIWFCVGPAGSDLNDTFAMDFNVRYWEQPF
jgi:hypothetical protein